ncbi:DUF2207 domain-containing protein [Arcanobacterium haemolyticum]|nr:DUF2207 domain-containing protein [Arcanobacterium haemolyticum]
MAQYFGITPAEAWVGFILVGAALVLLLVSLRPEREYVDFPRGVFPGNGTHRTRRVSSGEPPLRTELPEMTPADAALIIREADGTTMLIATLVDLATRGFLDLAEYRYLPAGPPAIVVIYKRGADESCTPEERDLLTFLEAAGAAEPQEFARAYPFDSRRYRNDLEQLGIPSIGYPTARFSGLRRSLSDVLAHDTAHRLEIERRWFRSGRQKITAAGALELVAGVVSALVSTLLWLVGPLRPFWIFVCLLVAVLGLATAYLGSERTAEGSVARDQVVGFRRYITEAPRSEGAHLATFARLAGWAIALDCVNEWEASLSRLAVGFDGRIDDAFPWFIRASHMPVDIHAVCEFIALMFARIHSAPESNDLSTPLRSLTDPHVPTWHDAAQA